ncbi:FAD-dependent oxidoreductase [Winogradskya humida]|uniref:Flavin-dependent monooxygenase n=1 Tax=Winogradskya humida TaxID=113566 RepID=A0ABQ4A5K0_9ACTN|nr:NAD(P)/FAD-dependent oxidoreductase [Actinoplanes humidus]GIE26118.1 oxidoreductase [Actinoplanes humidus]
MRSVAIVGAGLSGLVLARVLQLHGIDCTVYESDGSPQGRGQGGSLDIHEDAGQRALREAGLYDQFRALTHPQGQTVRVLDKAATALISFDPGDDHGTRPEIDRGQLRGLLIGSLDPGRIQWGHRVVEAVAGRITFADGTSTAADLLVGADGTWSRIRPLVSGAAPEYSGITYAGLRITDAAQRYPDSAALTGPGMYFALSDNQGMIGHGGRDIELGVSMRVPEDWLATSGVDWSDPHAARAFLLTRFAGWDPGLLDLIRRSDDTIAARQILALPIGHRWERVPGVTLIGDAGHVMSPFAGEGANLAMLDGLDLALALVRHGDDVEAALAEYETAMFARAAVSAEASARGLENCFAPDSPRGLTSFFATMLQE